MTGNAVEVEGLVKAFRFHKGLRDTMRNLFREPDKLVLDGVDLTVGSGEVVGVQGENGAGKTTLLKIIGTIIRPTAGTVSILGHDAVQDPRTARGICAYTFSDDRSFYWRLTGRQNLEFFAALHDIHGPAGRSRIEAVAENLGILPYLDEPFRFFSAGIRQRFILARALLVRPPVLLLDEPTRSVDRTEARRIWSLLRDDLVRQQGVSILLVTHSRTEAEAVCDRVLLLRSGKLVDEAAPDDSFSDEESLVTFALVVEGLDEDQLRGMEQLPGVRQLSLSGSWGEEQVLEVYSSAGDRVLPPLLAALAESGANLRSLERMEPVTDLPTPIGVN